MLNQKIRYLSDQDNRASGLKVSATGLIVATLVPLMFVTGCANVSKRHFTVGSVQDSYKTRHPIVIDEREQTLDLPLARNGRGLTTAQAGSVEGFAYRFRKSGSGVLTILMPQGSPNEQSAQNASRGIIDSITSVGVPYNRIRRAHYDAGAHGASAPIRLSYMAVTANVGECGKWNEDLAGKNFQNKNFHNFGCASQKNLAAIIANPSDLVAPRGMSDVDSQRRNEAIKDYREGNIDLGDDLDSSL